MASSHQLDIRSTLQFARSLTICRTSYTYLSEVVGLHHLPLHGHIRVDDAAAHADARVVHEAVDLAVVRELHELVHL